MISKEIVNNLIEGVKPLEADQLLRDKFNTSNLQDIIKKHFGLFEITYPAMEFGYVEPFYFKCVLHSKFSSGGGPMVISKSKDLNCAIILAALWAS